MLKGQRHTKESIDKIKKARTKQVITKETCRKISESNKKVKHTKEWNRKVSKAKSGKPRPDITGARCHLWKGGITSKTEKIRKSIEFRLWRESVFARDNWICQKCQERGDKLHPHHIQNFAQYPELRFAIDNGITFCKKCHKVFHKKYGFRNNTREQLKKFLNL